jgi:hypothetical protein
MDPEGHVRDRGAGQHEAEGAVVEDASKREEQCERDCAGKEEVQVACVENDPVEADQGLPERNERIEEHARRLRHDVRLVDQRSRPEGEPVRDGGVERLVGEVDTEVETNVGQCYDGRQ